MASWAAWASALPVLEALEAARALPYRALKAACEPRKPGIRKSNSAHSSSTLFWIGVPLRISLCCAAMRLTACNESHSEQNLHALAAIGQHTQLR